MKKEADETYLGKILLQILRRKMIYLYCTGSLFFIFLATRFILGINLSSEEFLYDFFSGIFEM